MSWNRKLWGVEFSSLGEKPILIGAGWMRELPNRPLYPGCPTRPILFETRRQARDWCSDKQATSRARGGVCAKWSYRAVRVQETVVKA